MNKLLHHRWAVPVIAALLAGCASAPPPTPEPPPPPPRDRVAELRTTATATRSAVEVAPLQNPAVDLLLAEAERQEIAGEHQAAVDKIDEALAIEPENPRLWQLKAEALLRSDRFLDAEKLAMKSFDLGSRIGEWCNAQLADHRRESRCAGRQQYLQRRARTRAEMPDAAAAAVLRAECSGIFVRKGRKRRKGKQETRLPAGYREILASFAFFAFFAEQFF